MSISSDHALQFSQKRNLTCTTVKASMFFYFFSAPRGTKASPAGHLCLAGHSLRTPGLKNNQLVLFFSMAAPGTIYSQNFLNFLFWNRGSSKEELPNHNISIILKPFLELNCEYDNNPLY